jgi:hypothetical protein
MCDGKAEHTEARGTGEFTGAPRFFARGAVGVRTPDQSSVVTDTVG